MGVIHEDLLKPPLNSEIEQKCSLATQYELGLGRKKDLRMALQCWFEAAELGDDYAYKNYIKLKEKHPELADRQMEKALKKKFDKTPASNFKDILKQKSRVVKDNQFKINKKVSEEKDSVTVTSEEEASSQPYTSTMSIGFQKALVISPSPEVNRDCQELLTSLGCAAEFVRSKVELLKYASQKKFNVEILLIDANFSANTPQFVLSLKKEKRLAHKPIFIMATKIDEADVKSLARIGVNGFLMYPFIKERFITSIKMTAVQ